MSRIVTDFSECKVTGKLKAGKWHSIEKSLPVIGKLVLLQDKEDNTDFVLANLGVYDKDRGLEFMSFSDREMYAIPISDVNRWCYIDLGLEYS